jgi:hypothetical protein
MSYQTNDPCAACGLQGDGLVCEHHLFTRKAYPELSEADFNRIPVCLFHHNEFHTKGTSFMAQKYTGVKIWLEMYGWTYDSFFKKWTR